MGAPSERAMQIFRNMRQLPAIAKEAEFSVQTANQMLQGGLVQVLEHYYSQCVEKFRDGIRRIINQVPYIGCGGGLQYFDFVFSKNGREVEYIGLAVRKYSDNYNQEMFDYCVCSYRYAKQYEDPDYTTAAVMSYFNPMAGMVMALQSQQEAEREYREPITSEDKELLQASFLFELVRRGLATYNHGKFQLLPS